jgi:hypothetical protein
MAKGKETDASRWVRLLRLRRSRPSCRRAANQRYERAAL